MRVLLVIPTYLYNHVYPAFLSPADFPVGFAYLAASLRQGGHEVIGLNPNNNPTYLSAKEMVQDTLQQVLKDRSPQLIGLGGLCTDFEFLRDAIAIIRSVAPKTPIVCGGGIVNNDSRFVLETLHPDFCILGEGEEVLVRLADTLSQGKQCFAEIPNLGYWKDGEAVFSEENYRYPELDKRPFPDYEPFNMAGMLQHGVVARYLYRYTRPDPRPMTIVTARGCPFSCSFCVHQRGPKYRARSLANVLAEIGTLYSNYKFNILIILDELFAVNKSRLREFSAALKERRQTLGWDFDWLFQTHASANLQPEDLRIAKEAGCYFFGYGVESASPTVLASMNKKTKPPQIAQAIEFAHEVKIGFGGNFIFGDIAETQETIGETLRFFSKHCRDDHFYISYLQPFPGSKLFEVCSQRGLIGSKKEFYEKTINHLFNMTSLPDSVWKPWIMKVNTTANLLPWAKSVVARSVTPISSPLLGHWANSPEHRFFEIEANCPYCGHEARFREFFHFETPAKTKAEKVPPTPPSQRPAPLLPPQPGRNPLSKVFQIIAREGRYLPSYLLGKLAPKSRFFWFLQKALLPRIFRQIRVLGDPEAIAKHSFVTGCPHCHKRIRVEVSPRFLTRR